ncbi:hypothetical protein B0H13DRAFT_1051346 [Mycena leptocephala]|jgi:hypothetical protein|nr:hypothetical protein B0H13DRAFT_1051346 [Mycena leptocephala]
MPGWAGLPPDGPRIPLNDLPTLMLKFYPPRGPGNLHFTPFLSRLSTPALQEVTLHLTHSFIWLERQFSAFQLRSPNITHLEVRYSSLASGDLRAALIYVPSMTHLELRSCPQCIDDDLLRSLSYRDGAEPLVPHLHHLTLVNLKIDRVLKSYMVEAMIVSRWDSGSAAVARWTCIKLDRSRWKVLRRKDILVTVVRGSDSDSDA